MELRGVTSDDATDAMLDCANRNDAEISDVATMVIATHDLHYAPDEMADASVPHDTTDDVRALL